MYDSIGLHKGKSKENNVISFLETHAQRMPGKKALLWVAKRAVLTWDGLSAFDHESITYGDLYAKIEAVSCGLKDLGITKGDRVILFVPLSLELYVSMFAVQRLGAIAVFLDSWARKDHLGVCAKVVEPKAMVSFEKAFDLCSAVPELADIRIKIVVGPHTKTYASDLGVLSDNRRHVEIEPVDSNDSALITFTTGSSGVPKGANRTHRFLAAQHRALDKEIPYSDEDKDLPVFPIFSLNNLAGGVTTILPAIDLASPSDKDAMIIINQITSVNATCCTVSPSIFVNMAQYCHQQKRILNDLKRVVTGGAPVSRDSVRAFKEIAPQAQVLVLYGSTEVEPIAHIEAEQMLCSDTEREGVNVGEISHDLEYKFIKISRAPIELGVQGWREWEVAHGDAGELIVSGEHVCESYYNNDDAFKSTKIKEENGKIWHRTGDVGALDEQGLLWLVGRVHNTIVRAGHFLFPVHAEILLKRLDFVKQAAFLGIVDAQLGEKTCVAFSLNEGFQEDHVRYSERIACLFKEHNIPVDEIRMVDHIPMDPRHHSKVEYSKLKEMLGT